MSSLPRPLLSWLIVLIALPLAAAAAWWTYSSDPSSRTLGSGRVPGPSPALVELQLPDGWAYRQLPELGLLGPVRLERGPGSALVAIDDGMTTHCPHPLADKGELR